MPKSKDGVRMPSRKPITFEVVENFNDRVGWCIVARTTDAYGQPLFYECTKQFEGPHTAMDVWTNWMRRMSVENEAK